uniref:CUB domain-containing protein n=1 Tax=Caenorhabditis tropicalis TaxID=1561998 RepID=A0A1I7TI99_9PELO
MFPRRLNAIPEDSETEGDEEEEPNRPAIAEKVDEEFPIEEFNTVEKQRHFGILQYHITVKFRHMMVMGFFNVILLIVFFLFILFFLELHKDNTSPVFAAATDPPGYCVWDDATPVEYDNFGAGHPNISQGLCIIYNMTSDRWYSAHCNDNLPHVDEMPVMHRPSGGCSDTLGDFCYFPSYDALPFFEAQGHCAKSCAQLTSVTSPVENEYFMSFFTTTDHQLYSLGGYAISKDTIFWLDGSPVTFNNLEVFNGRGCLYSTNYKNDNQPGNWFTANCSISTLFICKRPLNYTCDPKPVTLAPHISSSCVSASLQRSGTFSSPNYSLGFPANTNCTWTLVTYGPEKLMITFHRVQIGSEQIIVYDGDSEQGNYIGALTGDHRDAIFYTAGNVAFITFRTTGENRYQGAGFNASFVTVY